MNEQQPQNNPALLQVKDLETHFPIRKGLLRRQVGAVKAVDGVTFDISRGTTLGLVGESGCGKTTVGRSLLRLVEPTGGEVLFDKHAVREENARGLRSLRRRMQVVFQDPYGSLNPRMKIRSILEEGLVLHQVGERATRLEEMKRALERTGLSAAVLERYPHEFSGGQRQRIGIARALSLNPRYLVCDEPVSALDVSIQAQIINLLQELQEKQNLSILFISHDLNVVKHLSKRTAVMYLGQIVETAPTKILNKNAAHPYTRALLAAKPSINPKVKNDNNPLKGDVPSPLNPPAGCQFHPRCPEVTERCKTEKPLTTFIEEQHTVKCHLYS